MMTDTPTPMTPYQRAAVVILALSEGRQMTTAEVMRIARLRRSGALKMMGQISACPDVPIYQPAHGCWAILRRDDG